MSHYDLIIRDGMLVTETAILEADLAVVDERIVAIEPSLAGTSKAEIDATGLHVFPGLIDAHVHFNEPGRSEWEGIATGSAALAVGGGTLFFDMPLNAHPPTLDAASFDLKLAAAQHSSLVDFALWGGLVPGNNDTLAELAERGVIGFKAFMSNSGIDDFGAVDDLTLLEGMARAAQLGRIVAVHAENDQITGRLAQRAQAEGRTGVRDYLASRPIVAELEAIGKVITFAEETGCALHIVHVSSGRGVALVVAARTRGVDVSCETCGHYLALTEDDVEMMGALAKCAPPLRPRSEQDALWEHLRTGTLPMVTSDHSPAPAWLKGLELDQNSTQNPTLNTQNFFSAWGGISGCQSTLQVLLTDGYARRDLPLSMIAAATSSYVARRFDLPSRKGRIAVGADADLALVNLADTHTLTTEDLYYRHRHSPYVGKTMRGSVVQTLVRGTTIALHSKIMSQPIGRLVRPEA